MKSSTSDLKKTTTKRQNHTAHSESYASAASSDGHKKMKHGSVKSKRTRIVASALLLSVALIVFGAFIVFYGGIRQQGMIVSSEKSSVTKGVHFIVHVYADSGRKNVNAVQAEVTYPDDILQLKTIDTKNSAYPIRAFQQSNDGSVTMARGVIGGVTGKRLVADLVFVGIKQGDARISFNKSSTLLLASSTNQDILEDNNFNNISVSIK